MNHTILKTIIYDNHEMIRNLSIVDREYDFDVQANYVLVGLRRAGKSTLLYKIIKDLVASGVEWNQIIYLNFEDERLNEFTVNDFNDIVAVQAELSDKKGWFFLDEMQNIPGWERFARRMADFKEHIFITGSNASMLSSEIEQRLGGRYLTKQVTPYNFREFLTAKNTDFTDSTLLGTKTQGKIKREFEEYFYFGGFPETISYRDKREYVSSIYQKILLGDIAVRNKIRNTNGMKIMMNKIAESVKDEVSYSRLHNILKTVGISISKDVVIDYLRLTQESYLLFPVRNYFSKFVEKETRPKYYFADNGLLNLFLIQGETRLLENLVALSLKNTYKDQLYFLKSPELDIDFFVAATGTAVQVAYSASNISNSRETDSLKKASKILGEVQRLIIVTYEEEDTLTLDGIQIQVIPVWKWLLSLGR